MPLTTNKNIPYPNSSSQIAPLETHFANMATTIDTALVSINAGTDITAGTLPITRGGTGATTASAALSNLGGVPYSNLFIAGKNRIINGAFDVWQRGTSFTVSTVNTYTADRWSVYWDGTGATRVISQQAFTLGAAPVSGYEGSTFYRYAQTVAGTGGTFNNIAAQSIEDVRTFAGQTVTVSFWAKVDATRNLTIAFQQIFGTGGSPSAAVSIYPTQWYKDDVAVTAGASFTASTTWARYSTTVNIPSISGKTLGTTANTHSLNFIIQSSTVNATQTVDIWGVQVENGPVNSNFVRAGVFPQAELALCQRYYYRVFPAVSGIPISMAYNTSTTAATAYIPFPVTMRIAPTALERTATAGDLGILPVGGGTAVPFTTAASFTSASVNGARISGSTTTTVVAGQGTMLVTNSTAGYVGFSAEY